MSVLNQLRSLEQQVQKRLRELRPLVAEYRELEKVAERLGLKRDEDEPAGATSSGPKPKAPAKRRAKRAAAGGSKRAASPKAKPAASPARSASKPKPKPAAPTAAVATERKPKAAARSTSSAARSTPARGRAKAKAKPSARKRSAVAPGQREQDVLRIVGERPGVTVRELAGELGVDATGLYGVVRRLQGRGELTKDGVQLRVPDARPTDGEAATTGQPAAATESGEETGSGTAEESAAASIPTSATES